LGFSGREEGPEEEEVVGKGDMVQDGKKDTIRDKEEDTTLNFNKDTGRGSEEGTVQRGDRDKGRVKYLMITQGRIPDHEGKGVTVPGITAHAVVHVVVVTVLKLAVETVLKTTVGIVLRTTVGTVLRTIVGTVLRITVGTVLRTEEVSGVDKNRIILSVSSQAATVRNQQQNDSGQPSKNYQ